MTFERRHPAQGVQVRLPQGSYSIILRAYNSDEQLVYAGHGYTRVSANNFSEITIRLRKINRGCDGGLVINYQFEDDDAAMFDVCEYIDRLPTPACPAVAFPAEVASCSMPPFRNIPGMHGRQSCSVGAAKYQLLQSVCNTYRKVYDWQFKNIMCESSAQPMPDPGNGDPGGNNGGDPGGDPGNNGSGNTPPDDGAANDAPGN